MTLGLAPEQPTALAQGASLGGLLHAGSLAYEGAFRLPAGTNEQTTFAYGGTALAFDPTRNSIWAVGHDWYQRIAEFSIPTPVPSTNVSSLPRATLLSGWINTDWRTNVVGGTVKIGGILPLPNGDKIVTAFGYYDTVGTSVSHFRLAANGAATGPAQLGTVTQQGGFYAGWMVPVPAAWQASLGGPALTGQCCLSIITRTSFGPALAVFDPDHIRTARPVAVTDLLQYPSTHPTIGDCGSQGALFNCTANMAGAVFVAGTRSILFFQRIGTGPVSYNGGFSAPPYGTQVLAYDANDLVLVRQGKRQPWDIVPYATWDLPWTARILGVTYDPGTNRIFLSLEYQDGEQPLIHVFTFTGATVPALPPALPPAAVDKSNDGAAEGLSGLRRSHGNTRRGAKAAAASDREGNLRDSPRSRRRSASSTEPTALAEGLRARDLSRRASARASEGSATPPVAEVATLDDCRACDAPREPRANIIRSVGVVRYQELAIGLGVWVIDGIDRVYEPEGELDMLYQVEGLVVLFEASPRHGTRLIDESLVIDVLEIHVF